MATEQARGGPVDHRADLFSLGCVLYHVCTGRPPFAGPDTMAILSALATNTPTPPDEIYGSLLNDQNGDGVWDRPHEPPLKGWKVYIDKNRR